MPRPTDLLVLQAELVTLLTAELADIRPQVHIFTPDDLASEEADKPAVAAKAQPVPAVNVVYMGHRFGTGEDQQRTDGQALVMQQLFALEVVTRNVRDLKSGKAARADGGQLAMRVLTAAMGARLPSAATRLALRPGPGPVYRAGMQYLPLMVQASLAITKA
jgi:hypothetical protein